MVSRRPQPACDYPGASNKVPLRPYKPAHSTKKLCLGGLLVSCLLALVGAAVFAICQSRRRGSTEGLTSSYRTPMKGEYACILLSMSLATAVTLCNESLAFIHSTSLRWALWRENRLIYNTNLRLLTRSRTVRCNAWYTNFAWFLFAAVAYTAAGQIFLWMPPHLDKTVLEDSDRDPDAIYVKFSAFLALSFGLLGQVVISVWSLMTRARSLFSWDTDPLNNTLVCCHRGLGHNAYPQTDVRSHHEATSQNKKLKAFPGVSSLAKSRCFAQTVFTTLWITCLISFIIASWLQFIIEPGPDDLDGLPFLIPNSPGLFTGGKSVCIPCGPAQFWMWSSRIVRIIWYLSIPSIGIGLAIQTPFTFTLHCTELLVNARRDERAWRSASKLKGNGGAILEASAVKKAFTSWETIMLFVNKTLAHWAFGEFFQFERSAEDTGLCFNTGPLFLLASVLFVNAVFGTYLCFHRPSSRQPTTYGHFQTIMDYVDDWGRDGERLFWGDKSHVGWDADGEIRRMGTAGDSTALKPLKKSVKYIL